MSMFRHRGIVVALLTLVLCVSLSVVACASSASTSSTGATTSVTAAPPSPTATSFPPTATPVPGPFSGIPAFTDALTTGNVNQWDILSRPGQAQCQLDSSGYHLIIYPNYGVECFTRAATFGNFAFQVRMTFTQGSTTDWGGIVFRSNGDRSNVDGYDYSMRADGRYNLARCQPSNCSIVLLSGTASAFHGDLHVSNLLGVVAHGGAISLYVNGQLVGRVTDSSFTSGYLGLQNSPNNGNTQSEVIYTDAEAWTS